MTVAPSLPTDPLTELRVQVSRMEGRPAAQPVRTHPALNGLLQLQTGATYSVTSASLARSIRSANASRTLGSSKGGRATLKPM